MQYLLPAAERKRCREETLAHRLYLPETWDEARKDEIAVRRRALFMSVASVRREPRKLLLLLGEVRLLEPAQYGHRLVVKHAPDVEFAVDDDLQAALRRRFATRLATWEAASDARERSGHMIAFGTFSVARSRRPALEEVVGELTAAGRRFTRCLRYNLPRTAHTACAVAQGQAATSIARSGAGEPYAAGLDALVADTGLPSWVWRLADGPPPPLAPSAKTARSRARSIPTTGLTVTDPPSSGVSNW